MQFIAPEVTNHHTIFLAITLSLVTLAITALVYHLTFKEGGWEPVAYTLLMGVSITLITSFAIGNLNDDKDYSTAVANSIAQRDSRVIVNTGFLLRGQQNAVEDIELLDKSSGKTLNCKLMLAVDIYTVSCEKKSGELGSLDEVLST